MRLLEVSCPDSGSKTVWIRVRLRDCLINVVERQRCKHRAENFFLRDLHVVGNVAKNSWLDEKTFAAVNRHAIAASDQLCAFFLTSLDVSENAIHLLLADNCAHAGLRVERIGRLHFPGTSDKLFQKFVPDFGLDEEPRTGVTDFALAVENSGDRTFYGIVNVGVSEDDVGRCPAEFKRNALHGVGSTPHDFFADFGRPSEG